LFLLVPLTPPTDETGAGLWPTPDVRGFTNDGSLQMLKEKIADRQEWAGMAFRKGVSAKAKLWPTPTNSMATMADMVQAQYAGNDPKRPTYAQAKLMATPTAQDAKNSTLPVSLRDRDSIPGQLLRDGHTGQLNPQWVEWLMGYPVGWTDLNV
jgi:hypothetical protein